MIIRFFPLILFAISVLAYGTLVPWLGYYEDEWGGVYNMMIGQNALVEWQKTDRPFAGLVWGYFALVLGANPLAWHLFALLTKWFSATTFWLMQRTIWPNHVQATAAMALLFLLYPGVLQESRAFIFGFFWLQLSLIFLSFSIMARVVREPKFRFTFTAISLLCVLPTWFMGEYFIGLEILRPLVLWKLISNKDNHVKPRLHATIRYWLPYFIGLCIYLLWRILLFETTREEVNPSSFISKFLTDPVHELLLRIEFVAPDIVKATLLTWIQPLSHDLLQITSLSTWLAWSVGIIVGLITYFLLTGIIPNYYPGSKNHLDQDIRFCKELVASGIIAIVVGMLPIWFSGMDIGLAGMETRYALPAIIGACFLLYGLLRMIVGSWQQMTLMLSVLCSLATATHIKAANDFRHEWLHQKQLFWQLAWRAPDLTPNTLIWIHQEGWQTKRWPTPYPDIHYAAPINLMYKASDNPYKLNYWATLLDLDDKLFQSQTDLSNSYGKQVLNLKFVRAPKHNIIVTFKPPSCLRLLGRNAQQSSYSPEFSPTMVGFSNTGLIVRSSNFTAALPTSIFGSEPQHDWCYYYQKADLARQFKDWHQIGELGDEARAKGLSPADKSEWLLFITAYERIGRHGDATQLSSLLQP